MQRVRFLLSNFAFFFLVFLVKLYSFQVPDSPVGYVNDFAKIFSQDFVLNLENKLKDFDETTGNEIVVVTVPSLGGEDLEAFSMNIAEKWKIGKKGKDNGVIILVAMEEKKIRIEVGYGLEEKLTDAVSSIIIRNYIAPAFTEGNYEKGVSVAVEKIIEVITEGSERIIQDNKISKNRGFYRLAILALIFFAFIMFIDLIRYFGHLFSSKKKKKYSIFRWFLLFSITFSILEFLFRAFIFGRLGGYTGGSGGFSGGGFSGGGFSGGGGSFGGGGASGSW